MFEKIFLIVIFFSAINFVNAQNSVHQNLNDTLFFAQENFIIAEDTAQTDSIKIVKKENFIKKLISGNLTWSLVAIPFASYQPETNWGFGITGVYYLKPKKVDGKIGSVTFTATYTLNNQFTSKVTTIAYLDKNQKWLLYGTAGFNFFPDNFYGIGNQKKNLESQPIKYTSNNFALNLQPQTYIKGSWLLGISTHFRWENAKPDSVKFEQIPLQKYSVYGFKEYFMFGFGGVVSYDTRDNLYYPAKGMFFKSILTYYPKISEKSYQMGKIQSDFRHYIPIYKKLIFAYQFSTEWNFADKRPFQMLSTIGGMELLRGIRQNVWRNDVMAVLQTELRIPIWKIFKAAAFASIGDVYSLENWQWATPKIGYGVGLRIQFNKSKSNLRIDVARQNFGNNFSWYVTVNEAF